MKKVLIGMIAQALFARAAEAKLNIIATTEDFGSIAKEIGGDFLVEPIWSGHEMQLSLDELVIRRPLAERLEVAPRLEPVRGGG